MSDFEIGEEVEYKVYAMENSWTKSTVVGIYTLPVGGNTALWLTREGFLPTTRNVQDVRKVPEKVWEVGKVYTLIHSGILNYHCYNVDENGDAYFSYASTLCAGFGRTKSNAEGRKHYKEVEERYERNSKSFI